MKPFALILAATLVPALPALAQSTRPTTRPASAEDVMSRLLAPATRPATPTLVPASPREPVRRGKKVAPEKLLREGSYLADQTGHLKKTDDGFGWAFVVDAGDSTPARTFELLPNLALMSMARADASAKRDADFHVTGLVTEYRDKNYLLAEPASRDLRSFGEPTTDRSTGDAAVAPAAPRRDVFREGTYLVDRTGRFSRGPGGKPQYFTFDADGQAMQDPPVILLPNTKLVAMEAAVTSTAPTTREPRFRVTGQLTEYEGRNYLLMDKVVVVSERATQF